VLSKLYKGSISKKLVLLVLASLFPALAAIIIFGLQNQADERVKAEELLQSAVGHLAEEQTRITNSTRQLLQTLALMPAIREKRLPECSEILALTLRANPLYGAMHLLDTQGNALASGRPFVPANFADLKHFRDARDNKDFRVGEFTIGRTLSVPVITFGQAILGDDGNALGVLVVSILLERFNTLFPDNLFPPGSFVGIADHNGLRLYRYPESGQFPLGKPIDQAIFEQARRTEAGITGITSRDGVKRLNAHRALRWAPDQSPYMYLFVGIPEALITATAVAQMEATVAVMGGSALAAVAIAWFLGGRTFTRNIEELTASAARLGGGDYALTLNISRFTGETEVLAKAFNAMAGAMRTREQERSQAECALRESEERYRRVLDTANEGIWSIDADHRTTYVNAAMAAMLDYGVEDIVGKKAEEFFFPEDMEFHARKMSARHALQDDVYERRFRRRDGSELWTLVSAKALSDAAGRFAGSFAMFTDITERKAAEAALEASEAKYRSLFQSMTEGVAIHELVADASGRPVDYRIIDVNPSYAKLTGIEHGQALGRTASSLYGSDAPPFLKTYAEVALSGAPVVFESYFTPMDKHFLISVFSPGFAKFVTVFQDISPRKTAEAALEETRQFRDRLVNTIADPVFVKDQDFRFIFINEAMCAVANMDRENIIGRTDYDFFPAAEANVFRKNDIEVLETGNENVSEELMTVANGTVRTISTKKTRFIDNKGNKYVVGVVHDITDRRRTEEALEKRMVALTQPLDNAEGITFSDLFNVSDIQRMQDDFARAMGVASVITTPDGTPITAPSGFCRLCQDIVRATEKGLANCRRSDAIVGQLSTHGPNIQPCLSAGLWDAGAGIAVGGRHLANWLIGQVRDETQTEAATRTYAREIGADEEAMVQAFFEVPSMSRQRFEHIAKALFTLANQLSTAAYQNVQQARFISERKRAEAQLIEMKDKAEAASEAKSVFLANMSHEIRTPLNGVMGMLQLLQTTPMAEEQVEYLSAALKSTRRLNRLLSDILDLTRIEAGKLTMRAAPFTFAGLGQSLDELFGLTAREKNLRLEVRFDTRIPPVLVGDENRLLQVLFNLVGNAIKFTPEGEVRVEAWLLPVARGEQVRVLFTVSDTGIGIAPDMIKSLFEPFAQAEGSYTRSFQGAGLGLSLVRKLSGLLGGELAVDSAPGKGTTVYLSLPFALAARQPEPAGPEHAPAACPSCGPKRILLVEDDEVSLISAKRILEKCGHAVATAMDGRQALTRLTESEFDLILMDIQMPVMDGLEAARIIKASTDLGGNARIPIIAMTAYAMLGDKEKLLEAGMDGYLSKPVDMETLSQAIERSLAGAS
jgi:PAS domain S-box-containing protein